MAGEQPTKPRRSCRFLIASSALVLGACTSNLPAVELDFTAKPADGVAITVAPCHGEDFATCFFMHQQIAYPPADPNQNGDNIGVYDVPANVTDLQLIVEQTNPENTDGSKPCATITVHLKHNDEKLTLQSGIPFALGCPSGSDCDPPVACQ